MTDKRTYDLTNQATLDTDAYFVVDKSGWTTARRLQGSVLDAYFVEVAGDTMTGALTVNVNSATALLVEQNGVNDDVLVVDTGTPRVTITADLDVVTSTFELKPNAGNADAWVIATGTTNLWLDAYGNQPTIIGRRAGGTKALPSAVASGNTLLTFGARGYGATGFSANHRAKFDLVANQNWTDANQGTRIQVSVTPDNSTSTFVSMLISNTGRVGVGQNLWAPGAQLHVDQYSTSGAIPVLTLDQADIDVVLMKIIGTAAAASADRTLVAASDYGTPGALTGWIQVEIQDDGDRVADGDYYIPFYAVPT